MRAFFCHSRASLLREESRFLARSRMKIDNPELWEVSSFVGNAHRLEASDIG
jgi:hypothetical protein